MRIIFFQYRQYCVLIKYIRICQTIFRYSSYIHYNSHTHTWFVCECERLSGVVATKPIYFKEIIGQQYTSIGKAIKGVRENTDIVRSRCVYRLLCKSIMYIKDYSKNVDMGLKDFSKSCIKKCVVTNNLYSKILNIFIVGRLSGYVKTKNSYYVREWRKWRFWFLEKHILSKWKCNE